MTTHRRLTDWTLSVMLACTAGGVAPLTAIASLTVIAPRTAIAAAPPISVTLEPRQITVGESAQLTVTTSGAGLDSLTLPVVQGLEFRVVGQSRRLEIINGAALSTNSVIVRVTPEVAGIFTIPGMTPQSQPLVLRVSPDNGSAGNTPYGSNPYGSNPYGGSGTNRPPVTGGTSSATEGLHLTADGSAYVRMNLPKRDVYVGESIPVDIEVGMRAGFVTSLNGLPELSGNDFTLNNLSRKPERVEKLIDGKPFILLTWHSVLAPVKPGTFSLSVTSPLTIRVRTRPQRDSMIDDMLGDPFLQNMFGATVSKDIKVSSPAADLKVLALPTEGQPSDFSGAVGNFKIASDLSATRSAVGDPLTLRLHVTGSGNFDRVDTPMLTHVDDWKTYPPKATFAPSDPVGYKGEKTFEQPVIALHPGAQHLPGLNFSYFDPTSRRYETLHSAASTVDIAPAQADNTAPVVVANGPNGTTAGVPNDSPGKSAAKPVNGLLPDHAIASNETTTLVPLYLRPQFLALPSALALLLAGGWIRTQRRGKPIVPGGASAIGGIGSRSRKRRLSKANAQLLRQLDAAAKANDATLFFALTRSALTANAAADTALSADSAHPNDAGDIASILALADEANYAGRRMTPTDYEHWTRIVRERLEAST